MAYVQLLHTQVQRVASILQWDPKVSYEFHESREGFLASVEVLRHTFACPEPCRSKKDAKETVSAIAFRELNLHLPNRRQRPSAHDMLEIIKIWLSASLQSRQNASFTPSSYPVLLAELTEILHCGPPQYDRISLDGREISLVSVAGRKFGSTFSDPEEARNECARQAITDIVQCYCDSATTDKQPPGGYSEMSPVDPTGKTDMAIVNEVVQKMAWSPVVLHFHERLEGNRSAFSCELEINRVNIPPIHIDRPTWHRSKDLAKQHAAALAIRQLCEEGIINIDK
ncbi:hypothetical protein DFQ28_001387 [Apophysomyces sp. BC1034]|nr:hypothetical protein DFQ30_001629 [Apophysomyces sp. BC1015]KAG0172253.1 hypothetical protein DFQ29_008462 [Apophysomyces sp. BC1021]KAG0190905.1 hypothetical protein DFQ28_001387 [Apophysomyces sp. BC1034]